MATLAPERGGRPSPSGAFIGATRANAGRTRAWIRAVAATLIYAGCLFGVVMVAHGMLDRTDLAKSAVHDPALLANMHRL